MVDSIEFKLFQYESPTRDGLAESVINFLSKPKKIKKGKRQNFCHFVAIKFFFPKI